MSLITSITRPNGTSRTINYDNDGEITDIVERAASKAPIAFFTLNWANTGRVTWEFSAPLPHTNAPPTRTNTFDNDNRLKTVDGLNVTEDANGNMTYGPLLNDSFTNYTYDVQNRLLNAGGINYGYDPAGNRTFITNGASVARFVVNPNTALPQTLMRIQNGVTNYYIYGPGLLYQVTATPSGESTLTYHYDSRGSTVALTDGNGNVTDRIEYSVYGMTTLRGGTNDIPFLFNGRYGVQTDANGLLCMQARYYNPFLCRFVSADPGGFSGGLNWYAYANGDPISLLDPFGLGAVGENAGFWSWVGNQINSLYDGSGDGIDGFPSGGQIAHAAIDNVVSSVTPSAPAEVQQPMAYNFQSYNPAGPTTLWAQLMAGTAGIAIGAYEDEPEPVASSDVAPSSGSPPLANVLQGHSAGQGFTGVYDASTGNVLIAPSTAEAEIPAGWVPRAGGHADVSASLGGDPANQSGFAVILQEDGTLNITWRSGTLNPPPDYVVPPNLRPTIVNAVQSATGRTVNP